MVYGISPKENQASSWWACMYAFKEARKTMQELLFSSVKIAKLCELTLELLSESLALY
jgi:hypothetical protein